MQHEHNHTRSSHPVNRSVANNTSAKGKAMPAVAPVLQYPSGKAPIQMTTVDEWFEAGKTLVIAGEQHEAIPKEEETAYWDNKEKELVYEDEFLTVNNIGNTGTLRVPPDDHYARMLTGLNIVIMSLRAMMDSADVREEAAEFLRDQGKYTPVINALGGILNDIEKMKQVKQGGLDAPYTPEQQRGARFIEEGLSEIFELMEEVSAGTRNAGHINQLYTILQQETAVGRQKLGVAPQANLREVRSQKMATILNGYSGKVTTPSVYKVGELHIQDMASAGQESGDKWVAVTRGQYLQDTGLEEGGDAESD